MEMVEYFNVMTKSVFERNFVSLIIQVVLFLFTIFGIAFVIKKKAIKHRRYYIIVLILSAGITFYKLFSNQVIFFLSIIEYRSAYKNGFYQIVEGTVSNYNPMPLRAEENDKENFEIDGIHFSISNQSRTAEYSKTKKNSSPIQDGVYIRLYYIENKIIKLLVKE